MDSCMYYRVKLVIIIGCHFDSVDGLQSVAIVSYHGLSTDGSVDLTKMSKQNVSFKLDFSFSLIIKL